MTSAYKPRHGDRWLSRVFEPRFDFYAMLHSQAGTTLAGMLALEEWINKGAQERCQLVRDLEHEADEKKLELERKLVESFVTPFDREDIYDLSTVLDEVINQAKVTVREVEALDVCPVTDANVREMAATLVEGTRCLVQAFFHLNGNLAEASELAKLARKSTSRFAKIYRDAVRQLYALDDCKQILKTGEFYRCMVHASELIDLVGEKLLHVIVKMS